MKKRKFIRRIIVNRRQEGLRFETPEFEHEDCPANAVLFIGNSDWPGAYFTINEVNRMVKAIQEIVK